MSDAARLPASPRGERDDPRTGTTLFAGAISVILLVVIVLCIETLYRVTVEREEQRKLIEREPVERLRIEAEQHARLAEYRWVDRERGIVAIPIERAIDLVLAESAGGAR
jgi:hypothetical protein